MNKFSSFLGVAASFLSAVCMLTAAAPSASAQQSGNLLPVANTTGTPDPAASPALPLDAPANLENPPPPEKLDPNAPTETEILATNGANFSSQERIAVFLGDVRVNDPRFQLACDKLTVYLAKGATGNSQAPGGTPKPTTAAGNTPPASAGAQDTPGGGIDHAIAEGNVIIIQKRPPAKPGEEPKISRAHSDRADFDNKTGDMILHGTPSVEQNGNVLLALSPSTVITLHKDNSMTTVGPSRTVIKSKGNAVDLPGSSPGASPAPTGPGGKKPHPKRNGATAG